MAKEKCKECEKKKNKENEGGKKDPNLPIIAVVLKLDLHCQGCATKIVKIIRSFDGVESVKIGDGEMSKVTVVGKVEAAKLREMVEKKTKKKVELVSPLPPKKDKDNEKEKKNKDGGDGHQKKKNTDDKQQPDDKKSKEPPVTTVVLKVHLHCEGCIQKIHKVVSQTKGYLELSIDRPKDLVTVKGTMDAKVLVDSLKKKLKKSVEIVPPKKEGGGEKGKGGGGGGDGGGKVEGHKMEYRQFEHPYPYVYGSDYVVHHLHAPQLFSDENPNACAVM